MTDETKLLKFQLKIEQLLKKIREETQNPFGFILIGTGGGDEFRTIIHHTGTTDTEKILELLSALIIRVFTDLYKVENPVELIPFITGLQGFLGCDLYTLLKNSDKYLLPQEVTDANKSKF